MDKEYKLQEGDAICWCGVNKMCYGEVVRNSLSGELFVKTSSGASFNIKDVVSSTSFRVLSNNKTSRKP